MRPKGHAGPAGDLVADGWAGLAAMLVALPSAIAFGVASYSAAGPGLAGAGALTGIIGAVALGITAPLVGRNPGFITAPCAPAAAVLAGLAAELSSGHGLSPDRVLALLAVTAAISAILQVAYGSLGAGRMMKYIPYQVVSGYLSGVAVIIFAGQLPGFLGAPPRTHLSEAVSSLDLWRWESIVVGTVTIAITVLAPRVTKRVPAVIIGLAGGVIAYLCIAWIEPELRHLAGNTLVIGSITSSGSMLEAASSRMALLGSLSAADIRLVLAPAATLSVLLSIDTLKTGVVLDALTRRRHNSNRELVAQGIANAVSFGTGGMPGAGTMGATLVNVTGGSRTAASSVFAGLFALAAVLLFGEFIAWVPIASLAGILLVVSWRMFDFDMFRLLRHRATRLDFAVIAAVVVVAETVGLIQASVVGVCLAILLFIRAQVRSSIILAKRDLTSVRSRRTRTEGEQSILASKGGEGLLVQLKDDLFFGTTDQLLSDLDADLGTRKFVLIDLRRVQSMDYTAAHLFEQMRYRLVEREGGLLVCGMPSSGPQRQDIERYLTQLGVLDADGVHVFDTRDGALEWMEERILEAAGWVAGDLGPALEVGELELFRGLDRASVEEIAALLDERTLGAGERVFSRGEPGHEMYLVRRGRVRILLPLAGGKHHHLATLGPGEMFGEMSFLDRWSRSADAVADTATDLFVLSRDRIDVLAESESAVSARIFERIALEISHRLRIANKELRALEDR